MRILCLLILTLTFFSPASASSSADKNDKKKLQPAMVVGTVYCHTCFNKEFSKKSHFHFISGASVAFECRKKGSKSGFRMEAKTNEHGEFKLPLPFAVGEHVKRIRRCSVKLVSSSEPFCSVASVAASSSLRLKSRERGTHIFSSGIFTFKPLKQPELCYQKANDLSSSIPVSDEKLDHPTSFFSPPGIPFLPSPPPFGLPLPPNPFQPPPFFPPLPFVPPPPPFFNLPPIPFLTPPPPPPFFNLPPIPFFTPPPSPPPPPFFSFPPLPPFPQVPPLPFFTPSPPPPPPPPPPRIFPAPFPPIHFPPLPPIFPGIPPASPSKRESP